MPKFQSSKLNGVAVIANTHTHTHTQYIYTAKLRRYLKKIAVIDNSNLVTLINT